MATKKDSVGVEEFLTYMLNSGSRRTESYTELESKFRITPYDDPGNRAKKLWQRFKKSNLSVAEFMQSRFGHFVGDGVDAVEAPNAESMSGVEEFTTSNNGKNAFYSAPTDRLIMTKDEALAACNVDLSEWKLKDWKWRTWGTTGREKRQIGIDSAGKPIIETYMVTKPNYGIHLWFVAKDTDDEEAVIILTDQIKSAINAPKIKRVKSKRGVGVLNISDLHIGAEVKNLLKSPDFDMGKIVHHLNYVAEKVNELGYSEVYVNMLGDYFESISGHNHMSTFKSLERDGWGAKIIIAGCEILTDFLSKIHNLRGVNMISGNHDRMSADSREDNDGSAAHILFELLKRSRSFEGVNFQYSPHVLPVEIDNVIYILTHGHQRMNAKTVEKMIWRYGIQGKYNVLLEGHVHTRRATKSWMHKAAHFEDEVIIASDEADYMRITIPSIFTGNPYSMMLGYSTKGGFVIIENNERDGINRFDFSL